VLTHCGGLLSDRSPRAVRVAQWGARAVAVSPQPSCRSGPWPRARKRRRECLAPTRSSSCGAGVASTDKILGCEAANEVRSRLDDDADIKKLWIIPKDHIDATLKASGFTPCSPIAATEDKQLAVQLRGDAYLDGVASRPRRGYGWRPGSSWLAMCRRRSHCRRPRDNGPASRQADLARCASAMKQLPGETKCFNSARDGKYPTPSPRRGPRSRSTRRRHCRGCAFRTRSSR